MPVHPWCPFGLRVHCGVLWRKRSVAVHCATTQTAVRRSCALLLLRTTASIQMRCLLATERPNCSPGRRVMRLLWAEVWSRSRASPITPVPSAVGRGQLRRCAYRSLGLMLGLSLSLITLISPQGCPRVAACGSPIPTIQRASSGMSSLARLLPHCVGDLRWAFLPLAQEAHSLVPLVRDYPNLVVMTSPSCLLSLVCAWGTSLPIPIASSVGRNGVIRGVSMGWPWLRVQR